MIEGWVGLGWAGLGWAGLVCQSQCQFLSDSMISFG